MELHQFFLYLAIILIAARLFSEIAGRHGIPSVIGELLAGLLVGPSLLGWVSPDATMKLLAEIGIILLLFEVGMDTDLLRLARPGIKPIVVAVVGFALPFALGYAVCRWGFGLDHLVSLFIGGTLTATSIGITVRVLDDLGKRQTDEAQIVIGAAVLDDILGVLTLAFLFDWRRGAVPFVQVSPDVPPTGGRLPTAVADVGWHLWPGALRPDVTVAR